MEKENYPLIITPDITVNLFVHPNITLKGTTKEKIVKTIIEKNNDEFDSIVLDRDGILCDAIGTEYVEGERKAVARLRELADEEIDRRMSKLAESGCRNFFEYNLTNTRGDMIKPTLLFFLSRNLTRASDKCLWNLSVLAKAIGLFVFFCEPEDGEICCNLLGSSYLDITANENESYITEHLVTVDKPITL